MSANAPPLEGLTLTSAPANHAKTGFHHRHTADIAALPAIARAFVGAGYVLEMMSCEDRRKVLAKMRLVYTWNRFEAPSPAGLADRHLVQADLEPGLAAPSIAPITPAADWFEREVFDMYGVRFEGHPDLKRILLPDDSDFHALLKDFGQMDPAPEEHG